MANIIFNTTYSQNQDRDNEIRGSRDAFKNLLENNEELKAFDATIIITNKEEHDLTKFVLKEVVPETKKNEVRMFLNINFLEYIGG